MDKLKFIIKNKSMFILNIFLLIVLYLGGVSIMASSLIYVMWVAFGFVSFRKGYEEKINQEMTAYYRQKVDIEYNRIKNEISNN